MVATAGLICASCPQLQLTRCVLFSRVFRVHSSTADFGRPTDRAYGNELLAGHDIVPGHTGSCAERDRYGHRRPPSDRGRSGETPFHHGHSYRDFTLAPCQSKRYAQGWTICPPITAHANDSLWTVPGGPRKILRDDIYNGYLIPAGTIVMPDVW